MKTQSICSSSSRTRQTGVGLIEVLIAVLILSIGFLGIAALEAMSLSTNNSAMARSLATINSYSILDAMRADISNAKAGSYNTTVTANSCGTAPGSGASMATQQIYAWCTSLASALGAAAGTQGIVACDANGNCQITVQFDDSRTGGALGSNQQQFVTQAVL
jgi:type IV pilus assembly protein PilV